MKAYIAFTRKECVEALRTYKAFILGTIFLLFGFMNPIAAKVMPELLDSFLPEGMILSLPEPVALDAWMQFFKNASQMGMAVLLIIYSGITANELSKGTLVNMLTKGLSMRTVVLSKFTGATLFWSLSYGACVVITGFYTAYFWEDHQLPHLGLALIAMWFFGELIIALVILGGILTKSVIGSLLFSGLTVVILLILGINPSLGSYNPITLVSANAALILGNFLVEDFISSMFVCSALIVMTLFGAIIYSKRVTQ